MKFLNRDRKTNRRKEERSRHLRWKRLNVVTSTTQYKFDNCSKRMKQFKSKEHREIERISLTIKWDIQCGTNKPKREIGVLDGTRLLSASLMEHDVKDFVESRAENNMALQSQR